MPVDRFARPVFAGDHPVRHHRMRQAVNGYGKAFPVLQSCRCAGGGVILRGSLRTADQTVVLDMPFCRAGGIPADGSTTPPQISPTTDGVKKEQVRVSRNNRRLLRHPRKTVAGTHRDRAAPPQPGRCNGYGTRPLDLVGDRRPGAWGVGSAAAGIFFPHVSLPPLLPGTIRGGWSGQ